MKILYLCADPGIDLMGQSGGSIHIRSFVRALGELGHEVTLVCSSIGNDGLGEMDFHTAVRPAPLAAWNRACAQVMRTANRLIGRTGRLHPDLVRFLHNLTFSKVAKVASREVCPDFIYERYSLWGLAGLQLARDCSIPLVLEVNAPLAFEQQRYRGLTFSALARSIERRVWSQAHLLLAVSESLRGFLKEAGVAVERVRILSNAADTRLFRPDVDGEPVRRQFNLNRRFVVGFVGTFKPWHGVDLLVSAFRDLYKVDPSAHLLLIGDGPLRPSLEDYVWKTGLKEAVTFAGRVAHQDIPRYLAAVDVAVAPYPTLDEFYYSPLKLFEYMAAGRAVVASRGGQVAQIIEEGNTGVLFDPGDRAGLVECLRQLRNDPARREELGRRASAACRGYTWSQNAACVIDWVEPLVARNRAVAMPARGGREHCPS